MSIVVAVAGTVLTYPGGRTNTSYARGDDEAHALIRQALTGSGDIDPRHDGYLTIRLDPLPTQRATTAISELCTHLNTTETRYPGTDRILRFEIKNKETPLKTESQCPKSWSLPSAFLA